MRGREKNTIREINRYFKKKTVSHGSSLLIEGRGRENLLTVKGATNLRYCDGRLESGYYMMNKRQEGREKPKTYLCNRRGERGKRIVGTHRRSNNRKQVDTQPGELCTSQGLLKEFNSKKKKEGQLSTQITKGACPVSSQALKHYQKTNTKKNDKEEEKRERRFGLGCSARFDHTCNLSDKPNHGVNATDSGMNNMLKKCEDPTETKEKKGKGRKIKEK